MRINKGITISRNGMLHSFSLPRRELFVAFTTTFGGEAGVPVSIESCLHNTSISCIKKIRPMLYTIQEINQICFHLLVIGPGLPCRTVNEDVPPRGLRRDDWLHNMHCLRKNISCPLEKLKKSITFYLLVTGRGLPCRTSHGIVHSTSILVFGFIFLDLGFLSTNSTNVTNKQ